MRIHHLIRMARNQVFGGARTGDFWMMAAGLVLWRWAARRRRLRR